MEVRFTRRARRRTRWRRISEADVVECLDSPDFTKQALGDSVHFWKRTGDVYLRVTWVDEAGVRRVITATAKRRQPRGWTT